MPVRAMVVVAGGSGSRFGGDKLMAEISGRPLVAHTMAAIQPMVDSCVLVCRQDQFTALTGLMVGVDLVVGGPTRTASEIAGLAALTDGVELIGIHDGARPLVTPALIDALYRTAERVGGAVPVLPATGLLVSRDGLDPILGAAVAQTPQVFRAAPLINAYRLAAQQGFEGHDTADVVGAFTDVEIAAVDGDPGNIKVTYPADLDRVRSVIAPSRSEPQ